MSGKKAKVTIFVILLIALIAIQFVPVKRTNPQVAAPIKADADVLEILRESCYDCHSNETAWPWYSYVAPVSWLVVHDVNEAREHLNFSEWGSLSGSERSGLFKAMLKQVRDDEMPLGLYQKAHRSSRLNVEELGIFNRWADKTHGRGGPAAPVREEPAAGEEADPSDDPGGAVEGTSPEAGYYYVDEDGNPVDPPDDDEEDVEPEGDGGDEGQDGD